MKRTIMQAASLLLCAIGFAAPVNPPPLATTNTAGLVKPDGTTITIGAGGLISSVGGGGGSGLTTNNVVGIIATNGLVYQVALDPNWPASPASDIYPALVHAMNAMSNTVAASGFSVAPEVTLSIPAGGWLCNSSLVLSNIQVRLVCQNGVARITNASGDYLVKTLSGYSWWTNQSALISVDVLTGTNSITLASAGDATKFTIGQPALLHDDWCGNFSAGAYPTNYLYFPAATLPGDGDTLTLASTWSTNAPWTNTITFRTGNASAAGDVHVGTLAVTLANIAALLQNNGTPGNSTYRALAAPVSNVVFCPYTNSTAVGGDLTNTVGNLLGSTYCGPAYSITIACRNPCGAFPTIYSGTPTVPYGNFNSLFTLSRTTAGTWGVGSGAIASGTLAGGSQTYGGRAEMVMVTNIVGSTIYLESGTARSYEGLWNAALIAVPPTRFSAQNISIVPLAGNNTCQGIAEQFSYQPILDNVSVSRVKLLAYGHYLNTCAFPIVRGGTMTGIGTRATRDTTTATADYFVSCTHALVSDQLIEGYLQGQYLCCADLIVRNCRGLNSAGAFNLGSSMDVRRENCTERASTSCFLASYVRNLTDLDCWSYYATPDSDWFIEKSTNIVLLNCGVQRPTGNQANSSGDLAAYINTSDRVNVRGFSILGNAGGDGGGLIGIQDSDNVTLDGGVNTGASSSLALITLNGYNGGATNAGCITVKNWQLGNAILLVDRGLSFQSLIASGITSKGLISDMLSLTATGTGNQPNVHQLSGTFGVDRISAYNVPIPASSTELGTTWFMTPALFCNGSWGLGQAYQFPGFNGCPTIFYSGYNTSLLGATTNYYGIMLIHDATYIPAGTTMTLLFGDSLAGGATHPASIPVYEGSVSAANTVFYLGTNLPPGSWVTLQYLGSGRYCTNIAGRTGQFNWQIVSASPCFGVANNPDTVTSGGWAVFNPALLNSTLTAGTVMAITNLTVTGVNVGATLSNLVYAINYLWVGADAFGGVATNPPTSTVYLPSGSDGSKIDVWAFDDTTSQTAEFTCSLPGWNLTPFNAKVFWCSTNSGLTNVSWALSMGCNTNGGAAGSIIGAPVYVTNYNAGANFLNITAASPSITIGNPTAAVLGSFLKFHVARQTTTASNLVGNALFKGLLLQYASTNNPSW